MQKRIERLNAQSFDWVLLRSFLAVYRCNSVAGAARSLAAQQSTLSRHLTELEAQLGQTLFERTGRGLVATDAAQVVAQYALQMEGMANQMALALTAKAAGLQGTVRVSASQIFAGHLLPPIVSGLVRQYPGLQLELVASDDVPSLLQRATDIALRFDRPTGLNVVARKLGDVPIVAMAHTSYLQAMGTPVQASDLLQHQLIGVDQDTVMLPALNKLGVAVTEQHFRVRADDKGVCVRLLEAGAGIGFMASLLLDTNPELAQVLPDLGLPTLPCWLTTHCELSDNPLIRIVFDALASALSARLRSDYGCFHTP